MEHQGELGAEPGPAQDGRGGRSLKGATGSVLPQPAIVFISGLEEKLGLDELLRPRTDTQLRGTAKPSSKIKVFNREQRLKTNKIRQNRKYRKRKVCH